jgi:hypothetical protein
MLFREYKGELYPIPSVETAIKILRPNAIWKLSGQTFVEWYSHNGLEPPTWEEIESEIQREQIIYDYYEYERKRETDYPKISAQLDMLYHDMENGIIPGKENSTWFAAISKTKNMLPKPSGEAPNIWAGTPSEEWYNSDKVPE